MSFVDVRLDPMVEEQFMIAMAQDSQTASAALASAVKKAGSWTRNQSLRLFSAGAGISQANLKKARRVAVRASGVSVSSSDDILGIFSNSFVSGGSRSNRRYQSSVFIGTDPIKAIYKKAKAVQTPAGVRQGDKLYEHAFLSLMKSGHLGIFRRDGRDRLPITEVADPVDATGIFGSLQSQVQAKLNEILPHELDYYFNIRSAA